MPEMRFAKTQDGVRIAYTAPEGEGRPLVALTGWNCNAEFELRHPESQRFYEALKDGRPTAWVIPRGVGASQRKIPPLSLECLVLDVEAVTDSLGWQTFDLWGEGSGALAALAYTARHPGNVSRMVLWSACASWGFTDPGTIAALTGLMRSKWWLARRTMGDLCFPSGPMALYEWFVKMMGESIAPEQAADYLEFNANCDVADLVARVETPTMLLHRTGDRVVPISAGREMAALFPNARFVALEGDIALPYFGDTSYVESIRDFLEEGSAVGQALAPEGLTPREVEVLRLVAAGKSNRQIAEELQITVNTADRHVSNILTKIGASNRAEAASFAVRNGLA
jgi:pimeloyl-ACP methyl ester carboxylesterase/DNA-binding CsgD family transcriptional regulator